MARRRCSIRYRPPGASVADRPGGRDVVRRHAVAEHRQHPGAHDVADGSGTSASKRLEERRVLHVDGVGLPSRTVSPRAVDVPPIARHLRTPSRSAYGTSRTVDRGPRSTASTPLPASATGRAGSTGWPSASVPSGSVDEVDVHGARPGRRRPQAAATRDSSSAPRGGCGPRSCGCPTAPRPPSRSPVVRPPRTRRATAGPSCRCRWCSRSRPVEPSAQGARAARPVRVVHDHPRPRRQRGLHPRLGPQAPLDGLLGQQPGRRASPAGWRCWCSW